MHENLPDERSKRFVAVLNKKIEMGRLMNALGHMTAGLCGGARRVKEVETERDVGGSANSLSDEMCFLEYKDGDGGVHPWISHFPFIVLKADNSNKIRVVREECLKRGVPFTDFTSTMTVGSSAEQVAATAAVSEAELEYFGIVMFGETEELKEFTGKFSLFGQWGF